MINVGMTIREMLSIASNPSCSGDLYERIIKALELATKNQKLIVGCEGTNIPANLWNQKIVAIKSIRLATGWGLREAKEWIEEAVNHKKVMFTGPLDPEIAHQLCSELGQYGCLCWTTHA